MMRRLLAPLVVVVLALPAAALAKGAESATIQGPGVAGAISIPGNGEPGAGSPLGRIAEYTGFFPEAFGQSPDPTTDRPPKGDLGPRYTITYVVPGPNGARDRLLQDVYPYATPDPVTYMAPGQSFFDGQRTEGGWYLSPFALKRVLVEAGLPATVPSSGDGGSWLHGAALAAIVAAAAMLVAGAVGLALLRRRPRTVTTG